ncbi:uncharacterized protein BXZ73DRAFT_78494 [Epithele typhae]|uniref:uncharacterized protein n=1 Tax=Epithele typhae TaxID=378194 RepID=UPI002007BB8C|nr:uncharacterized protein BXZ73DRAFT_78494 [Epithele typhae]KAH9927444.1 hypothetical protein BXZ73DRAFT_78494 [Epithele typhae]
MDDLRLVHFNTPQAFLEATREFDDSFMGFCVGSLLDYLAEHPDAAADTPADAASSKPVYLYAIYENDDLLVALTRNAHDFAWMMSVPTTAAASALTAPGAPQLAPALALLARAVHAALPSPAHFDTLIGPAPAVAALVAAWAALVPGSRVHAGKTNLASRVGYATRASLPLPPPSAPPHACVVRLAGTEEDLEALVPLHVAFRLESAWRHVVSAEEARAALRPAVRRGTAWVGTVDGRPVGYVVLGRVTARTIAVRNVYVAPEARRRGVAGAMVRAVTRYYLGAGLEGVEGVPEGPPAVGWKREVNLNAADPAAERVYRRAGFMFPDPEDETKGGVDPETGRKAWYASIWREVEPKEKSVDES